MLGHEIKVKLNRNPTPNVNNKWEKMAEYSSHFRWYICINSVSGFLVKISLISQL